MRIGYKYTPEQRANVSRGHIGQKPWNIGLGGCKRGHDPSLYVPMPTGVSVCLGCKRENGKKYRHDNQKKVNFRNRLKRYGMTQEEYNSTFESQNGRCAICQTIIDNDTCKIDHNHDTGKVRGILCASCNTGVGLFKDSAEILGCSIEYLKKNNGQ